MKRIDDYCFGDRYQFDFKICTAEKGWAQVDTYQDAYYFGVWVNPITLETFTFCEGDTTYIKCENENEFKAEVWKIIRFYDRMGNDEQEYLWSTLFNHLPKRATMIDGMLNEKIKTRLIELGFWRRLH